MSNTPTPEQLTAFTQLSPDDRYDEFVIKSIEGKEVWGLSSDQGWAIIQDGEDEYLPVWPYQALAATWATDGYADCTPKAITLDDWMNKWLPGMVKDELQIAVCPDEDGEGIVVSAEELLDNMEAALGE